MQKKDSSATYHGPWNRYTCGSASVVSCPRRVTRHAIAVSLRSLLNSEFQQFRFRIQRPSFVLSPVELWMMGLSLEWSTVMARFLYGLLTHFDDGPGSGAKQKMSERGLLAKKVYEFLIQKMLKRSTSAYSKYN